MGLDDFQYLLLMGACLAVTLPLELVFGARVYRQPARLAEAMALPVLLFALWDVVAIARDHWSFNPDFVTGWRLPGNLPVEELAFFLTIPVASLLTYETVGRVLRGEVGWLARRARRPGAAGREPAGRS